MLRWIKRKLFLRKRRKIEAERLAAKIEAFQSRGLKPMPRGDCPCCDCRRPLKKLNANFCPTCGFMLRSQYDVMQWLAMQRIILRDRGLLNPRDDVKVNLAVDTSDFDELVRKVRTQLYEFKTAVMPPRCGPQ